MEQRYSSIEDLKKRARVDGGRPESYANKIKIVFIDRDGVVNKYPGDGQYITNHRDFQFIPGSVQGIKKLNDKNFKVFIISNQAGVSKGLYTLKDLQQIDKKLLNELRKNKAKVDGVYYCTHLHEDSCECRKPKPGLMHKALAEHNLKADMSFFIGDAFIDMHTAKAFGAKTVLVLSGREKVSNRSNWDFEPDYIFDNLLIAAHYLCAHYG